MNTITGANLFVSSSLSLFSQTINPALYHLVPTSACLFIFSTHLHRISSWPSGSATTVNVWFFIQLLYFFIYRSFAFNALIKFYSKSQRVHINKRIISSIMNTSLWYIASFLGHLLIDHSGETSKNIWGESEISRNASSLCSAICLASVLNWCEWSIITDNSN